MHGSSCWLLSGEIMDGRRWTPNVEKAFKEGAQSAKGADGQWDEKKSLDDVLTREAGTCDAVSCTSPNQSSFFPLPASI